MDFVPKELDCPTNHYIWLIFSTPQIRVSIEGWTASACQSQTKLVALRVLMSFSFCTMQVPACVSTIEFNNF